MNTISILREKHTTNESTFSAIGRSARATGRTVGEALDALTARQGETQGLALVQLFSPDHFFPELQQQRLSRLMMDWRNARSENSILSSSDQKELERLIDEELEAAGERAEYISQLASEEQVSQNTELATLLQARQTLERSRRHGIYAALIAVEVFQLALIVTTLVLLATSRSSIGLGIALGLSVVVVALVSLFWFKRVVVHHQREH